MPDGLAWVAWGDAHCPEQGQAARQGRLGQKAAGRLLGPRVLGAFSETLASLFPSLMDTGLCHNLD